MQKTFPTISICGLLEKEYSEQDITVYSIQAFLETHKNIKFPHRHSFYQLVFITQGSGLHYIDFHKYPIKKGMIFFMTPSQIHEWVLDNGVNGLLINFNETFFSSFLANKDYLNDFALFSTGKTISGIDLSDKNILPEVEKILLHIQNEYQGSHELKYDLIRALLLQVLILLNREIYNIQNTHNNRHGFAIFRDFEKLIEQHYLTKRLPKEYANILCITPNYLNAICNQISGKSAGEIIRNRILLEAKRLLANSHQSISEIAFELQFEDNSYFTKFFKKYEGITPEKFRELNGHI